MSDLFLRQLAFGANWRGRQPHGSDWGGDRTICNEGESSAGPGCVGPARLAELQVDDELLPTSAINLDRVRRSVPALDNSPNTNS